MKPYSINFINAIVLIVFGMLGYFGSDTPSLTALIPVFTGIVLAILGFGFKAGNRTIAHIVVIITLLILIALVKPLSGAISRQDNAAIVRVVILIAVSLAAMVIYIKSFVDARIKRSKE